MMTRLGILGTGRIARRFVSDAAAVKGLSIEAVYNPHRSSARQFAEEFHVSLYTDSIEEFINHVDAVYIASPHATHYMYTKELLSHCIHVLCEKPMALKREQACELFLLAEKHNCILMEAIKTAYCPGYQAILEAARSGKIGDVCDVEACFSKLTSVSGRELTDTVYGGSFTELGTYPMLAVFQVLGTEYNSAYFRTLRTENGLDAYVKAEFIYENALGLAKTGLRVKSEGQLIIAGTKGYLLARAPWWLTREFEVHFENPSEKERYTFDYKGQGLHYEAEAFIRAIRGENTIKVMPEVSIKMAETMEQFLEKEKYWRER